MAQWITRLTTDQEIPGTTPGKLGYSAEEVRRRSFGISFGSLTFNASIAQKAARESHNLEVVSSNLTRGKMAAVLLLK